MNYDDKNDNMWAAIQFRARKIDANIIGLRPIDLIVGNYEADVDEFIDEVDVHYNDVSDIAGHNIENGINNFFGFPCKIKKLYKRIEGVYQGNIPIDSLLDDYFVDVSQYEYVCFISEEDIQKKSKNCVCLLESKENYSIDMFKDFYTAIETKVLYIDEKEKNTFEFDPIDVLKKINERVISQEEAAEQLVNTIYINQKYNEYPEIKSNILIAGPPGTGKTELIRSLSEVTGIPLFIADATKYTSSGYVGKNVTSMLEDLYKRGKENLASVQRGIIVIDEADKLCTASDDKNTVRKKDVQEELLGLVEGNIYSTEFGDIDTKGITFILVGAFSNITNVEAKKQNVVGFEREAENYNSKKPDADDFFQYGMNPELLRRLPVRIFTNALSKEDLKKILTTSKISNLRIFEEALKEKDNIKLVYNDKTMDAIVEKAQKFKGGASGLKSAVTNTLLKAIVGIRDTTNAELIISPETVENPNQYKIKKKTLKRRLKIVNYQKVMDNTIEQLLKEEKVPTLLLHSCCAPCSSYVLEYLSKYFKITIFYYNPNIYPESEFIKRLEEEKRLINEMTFENPVSIIEGKYDNDRFNELVKGLEECKEGRERCFKCYRLRLEEAAIVAKKNNFDYFTTTLSISPYKNSNKLNEIGEQLENQYNVKYLYADFKKKEGYKRSIQLSNIYGLYRQNYCGCIYSKKN